MMTRVGRRRAGQTIAGAAALLAVLAGGQLAQAVPVLDTNINDFVLFAFTSLEFKGGNLAGWGYITGGNVGVNRAETNPNATSLNIGANGAFVMIDHTQVVADVVRFDSGANVWDAFYNTKAAGSGGIIRDAGPIPFTPPILLTEPLLPFTPNRTITNNASNLHVTSDLVLGPGNYKDVTLDNGVTLTLGAGVYNMRNFHAGKHDTIIVSNGTILNVDGSFDLNDDTDFGTNANPYAQINAGSFGVGSNNATINFGQGDTVYGQFFSPNGQLSLGRQTEAYGRFWGNTINTDFNENITYFAPPPPRPPDSVPIPEPVTALERV